MPLGNDVHRIRPGGALAADEAFGVWCRDQSQQAKCGLRLWPGAIDVEEIEDAVELTGGQDGERIHTAAREAGTSAPGAAAVDSGCDLAGLGHACGGADTAETLFITVL